MDLWGKPLLAAVNALLLIPSLAGLVICIRLMWLRPHPGDATYLRWRKRITLGVMLVGLAEFGLAYWLGTGFVWVVLKQALYFVIAYLAVPKCSRLVRTI